MMDMYDKGKKGGSWTVEDLKKYGWVEKATKEMPGWKDGLVKIDDPTMQAAIIRKSAQRCLAYAEVAHKVDLSKLANSTSAYAAQQREFLRGLIEAARESLGKIIGSSDEK